MPSQSLGGDEGDLVSQRHLTLKVILAQLNHHNPKVRRDALHELKDIIIRHDAIVKFHLGEIVLAVVKVIIDADAVVRKSYLLLLPELFERISTHTMVPFTRLFVVYICSGLTSLDEAIRFDSLRCLDIMVTSFPRLVYEYSGQILSNLVDLLSAKLQSTSVSTGFSPSSSSLVVGKYAGSMSRKDKPVKIAEICRKRSSSVQNRVVVLHSLHHFLSACFSGRVDPNSAGVVESPYKDPLSYNFGDFGFLLLHRPMKLPPSRRVARGMGYGDSPTLTALGDRVRLSRALGSCLPHLRDLWLECRLGSSAGGASRNILPGGTNVASVSSAGGGIVAADIVKELGNMVAIFHFVIEYIISVDASSSDNTGVGSVAKIFPDNDQVWASIRSLQVHMLEEFPFAVSQPAGTGALVRGSHPEMQARESVAELNLSLARLVALFDQLPSLVPAAADAHGHSARQPGSLRGVLFEPPGLESSIWCVGQAAADCLVDRESCSWRGSAWQLELYGRAVQYVEWIARASSEPDAATVLPLSVKNSDVASDLPFCLVSAILITLRYLLRITAAGTAFHARLLAAFSSVFAATHWRSRAKHECIRFIFDIASILHPPCVGGAHGRDTQGRASLSLPVVAEWLFGFPELVWRLETQSPETTHLALSVLLSFARQSDPNSGHVRVRELLLSLGTGLMPFFCSELTVQPLQSRKVGQCELVTAFLLSNASQHVFGPFLWLPEDTQCLAIALLQYIPGDPLTPRLARALAMCASSPLLGTRSRSLLFSAVLQNMHSRNSGLVTSETSGSFRGIVNFLVSVILWVSRLHPSVIGESSFSTVVGRKLVNEQLCPSSYCALVHILCQEVRNLSRTLQSESMRLAFYQFAQLLFPELLSLLSTATSALRADRTHRYTTVTAMVCCCAASEQQRSVTGRCDCIGGDCDTEGGPRLLFVVASVALVCLEEECDPSSVRGAGVLFADASFGRRTLTFESRFTTSAVPASLQLLTHLIPSLVELWLSSMAAKEDASLPCGVCEELIRRLLSVQPYAAHLIVQRFCEIILTSCDTVPTMMEADADSLCLISECVSALSSLLKAPSIRPAFMTKGPVPVVANSVKDELLNLHKQLLLRFVSLSSLAATFATEIELL